MTHNAVELIKADHDKVESLYQQYQGATGDSPRQRTLVEKICRELEIHAALEESIFYPAVQAKLGTEGRDLVKEAVKEHKEMKQAISQLQTGSLTGANYDSTFRKMMSGVQHHVREEEGEMLPKAQRQMGPELDRLGQQMQRRKEELMAHQTTAGQSGQGTLAQRKTVAGQDVDGSSTIEHSIDVSVPVRTAYNQWTQFEEFPRFMEGVQQVTQLDDTHLHWQATVGGKDKEWDAMITEQVPDQRIAWTNTTGARNAGVVTFHRLAEDETRIMLQIDYEPEGVIENVGDMVGVVSARIRGDLQRFKDFIESRGTETGAWRGTVERPAK